jgi:hypothetical protein
MGFHKFVKESIYAVSGDGVIFSTATLLTRSVPLRPAPEKVYCTGLDSAIPGGVLNPVIAKCVKMSFVNILKK